MQTFRDETSSKNPCKSKFSMTDEKMAEIIAKKLKIKFISKNYKKDYGNNRYYRWWLVFKTNGRTKKGKCACCSLPLGNNFHLDHILPITLGGPNIDSNIQLLRQRLDIKPGDSRRAGVHRRQEVHEGAKARLAEPVCPLRWSRCRYAVHE
jgi:hypothetical protein